MKRRILGIDGMYFANRVLGGMTSQDETITLESEQEQHNLLSNLHNSLWSLVRSFNSDTHTLIHNVVMFSDYGSWRKKLPAYTPAYYEDVPDIKVPVLGYKENRIEKKQKSVINYDIFYRIVARFMDEISEQIPLIKIPDLEGDDCICLMSYMLKKSTNTEMVIFCTDGDLEQCVNDNVMLFRNIRSKDCPNGEFVISQNKFRELFVDAIDNPMTRLLGDSTEKTNYRMLFSMQLNSEYTVERKPGKDIRYACPATVALKKIVCGDAKDNVFPILRKVGESRNRSVSEKELIKTIEYNGEKFCDETCANIINNEELRQNIFLTMRDVFKFLPDYSFARMEEHFQRNKNLILLVPAEIGKDRVKQFVEYFKENVEEKFNQTITIPDKEREVKDNATELYADAVKGIL